MEKTIVIFRKFKDLGDIVALFPAEIADNRGNCMSYQHVGQHGAADYVGCVSNSVPASPSEYMPLQKELERIGYDLIIQKRYQRSK